MDNRLKTVRTRKFERKTEMLKKLRTRADQEGFTLIELLIVITILGVLAAIVVFAVGTTGSNARTNACKADMKTVETALEAFKAQSATSAYPPSADYTTATGLGNYLKDTPTENFSWSTTTGVVTATPAC
jgi:prepilin-type N-terminal cleavage/methylation domain-containing protein